MRIASCLFGILLGCFVSLARADSLLVSEIEAADLEFAVDDAPVNACWKQAKFRGLGHKTSDVDPITQKAVCKDPLYPDYSFGLCYSSCPQEAQKMTGEGPLCWQACDAKSTLYNKNGRFFCCETWKICRELNLDLTVRIPAATTKLIADLTINPANVVGILQDYRKLVHHVKGLKLPICLTATTSLNENEPIVTEF